MNITNLKVEVKRQYSEFEIDTIGVNALLGEGDDLQSSIKELYGILDQNYSVHRQGKTVYKKSETGTVEKTVSKNAKVEEEVKEEEVTPKKEKKTTPKKEKEEEVKEEAPVETEEETPKKEKKTKAKRVLKGTAYDRAIDLHKKLLGEMLDSNLKGWRAKPLITKCQEASAQMNGEEFLDTEGNVLSSFIEKFLSIVNED